MLGPRDGRVSGFVPLALCSTPYLDVLDDPVREAAQCGWRTTTALLLFIGLAEIKGGRGPGDFFDDTSCATFPVVDVSSASGFLVAHQDAMLSCLLHRALFSDLKMQSTVARTHRREGESGTPC
jgi:hypothetical protein